MPRPSRAPLPDIPMSLPAALFSPWVDGSLLYNRWLMDLLDAQTASWRAMERQAASWMQLWFDPAAPQPSAQPLVDAAQGIVPLGPAAWQEAWSGWFQVWADAMRHDASEV